MEASEHMNYLALNQNIFNKAMVIGSGPQEGTSETPISTFEGLNVYLNGTHIMPEHEELDTCLAIGSMIHPDAMLGMPGSSGELSYEFWVTEKEYIIVVRLKLDEFTNGESEPAADILALIKREELPSDIVDAEENYSIISREMIGCHFDTLFEFYKSMEDLEGWTFEDDTLNSFVKHHFDLKSAVKFIDKEI